MSSENPLDNITYNNEYCESYISLKESGFDENSKNEFRKLLIDLGLLSNDSIPINSFNKPIETISAASPVILSAENHEYINALLIKRREELATDELKEVDKVLKDINKESNKVVIDMFNIGMTEKKLTCLLPYTWLNDEVINFYMSMLQARDDCYFEEGIKERSSHYFNTFFIDKLLTKGKYNYDLVRRWTKKFNVFKQDKIFIPVNISNTHWTMIVVYIQLKKIYHHDSMNGEGKNKYLRHVLRWLQDESKTKFDNYYNTNENDWQLIDREANVPQQDNGYDCGMFSILCADFLSDDIPLENSYAQEEILLYRKKVCAAIIRGSINY